MKNKNEEIDQLIHQALSEDEAKFYDELGEQSVFEMLGGLFHGRLKWLNVYMIVAMLALFVVAIYCLIQFYKVEELKAMIIWSGAFFLCMMSIGLLKLFSWIQIDKNAIMREIKRLELQVSMLNKKK